MSDQLPTAPLIERFQDGIRANADPRMLAERMLRGSELALEAARRDAADAMLACEELSERIMALEGELIQARQEPERLQGLLASERRARRLAEQQAYAEGARREELQQELAAERERDQTGPEADDRAEADERRRELEAETRVLRRQGDELSHLLGSAQRARERAERRVAELTVALERAEVTAKLERASGPGPAVAGGLAREFALAAQLATADPPMAQDPPRGGPDSLLALERELVRARAGGATAPAGASDARAVELERELAEQIRRSSRAYDAIEELRRRLGAIGAWSAGPPEPEPPRAVPEPPRAGPEPGPSRALPEPPRAAPERPGAPALAVEPERFSAALTRLRAAVPPEGRPPDSGRPSGPVASPGESLPGPATEWLPGVFRRLAREDAALAGQLVLELLPAQRTAYPEPIAYDIELPGQTCIQLTVAGRGQKLELGHRRPLEDVRFAVTTDTAGLARLLAAGRIARRLRRGLPKVTGDRRGLEALDALVRAPLSLRQLHDSGVQLEPRLALEVVARMIDSRWTRGSRFALGYRPARGAPVVYLMVRDGESVTVSDVVEPALVAGTITGQAESLLGLLDGQESGALEFAGERAQLANVISWVKRAQSG